MAQLLRGTGYDLLFTVTNPPWLPLAPYLISHWRRISYVYLIYDLYPDVALRLGAVAAGGMVARASRWYQQHWLRGAERVIVLGRCMRNNSASTYGLCDERVTVITNWADGEMMMPLSLVKAASG